MKTLYSIVQLLLWPLLWAKRLMGSQVRLRRHQGRWRLVLEDPQAEPATPSPKAAPRQAKRFPAFEADETQPAPEPDLMYLALHELLAQHGRARQRMRHLAFLERTLKLSGAEGLSGLPLDVLKKALVQLEEFVSDWSSPGLAQLRIQLAMEVADKEDAAEQGDPSDGLRSDFLASRQLQVSEASPSDFEAAERKLEMRRK